MAKDAKGHGSEGRGGPVTVSVDPSKIGYRIADIGPGGVERNITYGGDAAAAATLAQGHPKSAPVPVHGGATGRGDASAGAGKRITILHQDGEYAVPNGGGKGGKAHYFTNDKADAESTARTIHGHGITITHRSKRWGPEMD